MLEHTTEAGYTEIIFALFDLLGFQFAPHIRDLGDQRLYRIDRSIRYCHLEPLLTRTIVQLLRTPRLPGPLSRQTVYVLF